MLQYRLCRKWKAVWYSKVHNFNYEVAGQVKEGIVFSDDRGYLLGGLKTYFKKGSKMILYQIILDTFMEIYQDGQD